MAMIDMAIVSAPLQLAMRDEEAFNASIGILVHHGELAAPRLAECTGDENDLQTRFFAIKVLSLLDPDDAQPATPALVEALNDPDPRVSSEACTTLAKIAPNSSSVIERLAGKLHDPAASPWDITDALAKAGTPAAIEALARAVRDGPRDVAMACVVALSTIGPPASSAIPILERAAQDADRVFFDMIQEALAQIQRH
jgi:HEAT repeat protein